MNKLQQGIQELKNRINDLEKRLKKEPQKDTPEVGDLYYFMNMHETVDVGNWNDTGTDNYRLKIGNCFFKGKYKNLEKAAKMYALRLEAYAQGYIPKEGEKAWWWDFDKEEVIESYGFYVNDKTAVFHKTKEDCERWAKKYAKAFNYFYNPDTYV